jgi:adenylate cyclase
MLGQAGNFWNMPFVRFLDNYFYDMKVRTFMSGGVDQRIVIVDVDEKSLAELGHWPWGRNVVADLVRRLTEQYKVAVIGFDIVFAEPDNSSGLGVFEAISKGALRGDADYLRVLGKLRPQLDYDRQFASVLQDSPSILGYYFSNQLDAREIGELPPLSLPTASLPGFAGRLPQWRGYGANIPVLQRAGLGAGHFTPLMDPDGNVRRIPLLIQYKGGYYEALSIAILRALLGETELRPGIPNPESPMEWLDIASSQGVFRIPVDEEAAALVPYRGEERSFPYVSAADVVKGRVAQADLEGKIILIGTTAPGLNDLRSVPVGSNFPGVEIHANFVAGVLDGTIKEKPAYILAADLLNILVFGGILVLVLPFLSPTQGTLLAGAVLATSLGINLALWEFGNVALPLASALLALLTIYGFNMAWGYFTESRVKQQFSTLFGQYVPPELVDEMVKDPARYSMEGRNDELTVLFSDVRGFTSISEGMDPKELVHLMNAYLGSMTRLVREHRGTLDKYIGDAIMAFWGAPVADAAHARQAVLTALAMQEEMLNLAESFRQRGWPVLQIGIGINTGIMTVGDMGSEVRKAYTVMGDAVNLGARLEGITKEYGVGIIVGELTREKTEGIAYRELDRVRVKGKLEPIAIFEPLGQEKALSPEQRGELDDWHAALAAYRQQQWDMAAASLRQLAECHGSRVLYELYQERIAHLRAHPPAEADWDGVTTFTVK